MSRESKSAFARRLGVAPSYVTKLAHDGRLMVVDGQVEVEASLSRLDATKDPNRDDVRQRHAKARDAKRLATGNGNGAAVTQGGAKAAFSGGGEGGRSGEPEKIAQKPGKAEIPASAPGEGESTIQAAEVFRRARMAKMHFESRRAVIRVARLNGRLADVATIRKCAGNDGATLRSMLENLPDQAAPRLAPVRDPAGVARILGELLDDVAATMAGLLAKNIAAMREGGAG